MSVNSVSPSTAFPYSAGSSNRWAERCLPPVWYCCSFPALVLISALIEAVGKQTYWHLKELCEDPPPPHCAQLLNIHKTSTSQVESSHTFKWFPEQPSSLSKIKVSPLLLTVDGEQYTGIAHPHHVLSDAGKKESIVLTGDIHQGQIDGMNIGPVEIGLKIPEKYRQKSVFGGCSPSCYCHRKMRNNFHIR